MNPVLFAGPSIYGLPESEWAGFDLMPPAACGDVLNAVKRGTCTIGLIDGYFGDQASVHHKEILYALEQGARVFGSSSMGALRASECYRFGMIGIGKIFDQYRTGIRVADADVAVLHGPAALKYVPITVALVDAEAIFSRLLGAGTISGLERTLLVDASRALGFRDRTWHNIISAVDLSASRSEAILNMLTETNVSQKRDDARELISEVRQCLSVPSVDRAVKTVPVSKTAQFVGLMSKVADGRLNN